LPFFKHCSVGIVHLRTKGHGVCFIGYVDIMILSYPLLTSTARMTNTRSAAQL
jgi:hypothetical protein